MASMPGQPPNGSIEEPDRANRLSIAEVGLGLRADEAHSFITSDQIRQMKVSHAEGEDIAFTRLAERGVRQECLCRPSLGYAVLRFRTYLPPKGQVQVEISSDDFRNVDGVMLPFLITRRDLNWYDEKTPTEAMRWEARVVKYRVNDPSNTPESYLIAWPKGTSVLDRRTGVRVFVKQDGVRLTDALIHAIANREPSDAASSEYDRERTQASSKVMPLQLKVMPPQLTKEPVGAESRLSTKRGYLVGFMIGCCIVSVLLFFWWRSNRDTKRAS